MISELAEMSRSLVVTSYSIVSLPKTNIWQSSYSPLTAESSFVNVTKMTILGTSNNNIKLTEIDISL